MTRLQGSAERHCSCLLMVFHHIFQWLLLMKMASSWNPVTAYAFKLHSSDFLFQQVGNRRYSFLAESFVASLLDCAVPDKSTRRNCDCSATCAFLIWWNVARGGLPGDLSGPLTLHTGNPLICSACLAPLHSCPRQSRSYAPFSSFPQLIKHFRFEWKGSFNENM